MARTVDPVKLRRRRQLCIVGLAFCAFLATASVVSFWKAPSYFGDNRQILFMGGGLLVQGAPSPVGVGFFLADPAIPNRGFMTRLRGWLTPPHRMGAGSLFIPFGPVTVIPAIVFGLLFWYWSGRSEGKLCSECGYDLRGAEHAVCPECGTPTNRELIVEA